MTKETSGTSDFLRVDFASMDLTDDEYRLLTGLKKDQFDDLFSKIAQHMRQTPEKRFGNATHDPTVEFNAKSSRLSFPDRAALRF